MKLPADLSSQQSDDGALDLLLAPLPGPDAAGVWLRYDPQYRRIQDLRQEDDATLPMGEWERPLRQADWGEVAALCCDVLATRGKDLQVAAWLSEAWLHLHGAEGLTAGVNLLLGLAERYWDGAWPRIEAGEHGPRCAPFIWADKTLAFACTQHLPLLKDEGREPPWLYLDDWRQAVRSRSGDDQTHQDGPAVDLDLMKRLAALPVNQEYLRAQLPRLESVRQIWSKVSWTLNEQLGPEAPGLRMLDEHLSTLLRAGSSLLNEVPEVPSNPAVPTPPESERTMVRADLTGRDHAYRQLGEIADYLRSIEPHSPTPYLLRKAVDWGRMSPEELMRDVMQDDGTFARYLSLLGRERE